MDLNKGIDEQVSNRVDAYRGNPQQLMKMYQQNQELVDLLALQKLKSEKDAAKRQIEMQMQQQPGTVKQQREQELMQMTKDDLAKQTQGVLQRKQQQQQANLQRAAKSGLGAIAPRRPAPVPAQAPKPMMAGGGIVAFQPGGSVRTSPLGRQVSAGLEAIGENTERQKLETQVRTLYGKYGAPLGVFRTQSDRARSQAKDILDRVNAGSLSNQQLQMLINQFPQFQESVKQTVPSGSAINVDEMVGQGVDRATAPYINKEGDVKMKRGFFGKPTISSGAEMELTGVHHEGYYDPDAPAGSRIALPLDKRNATKAATRPFDANAMAGAGALPAEQTGGVGGFNMDTGIAALTTPKVAAAPATKPEAEATAVDNAMAAVNTQMAGLPAISGGSMGGAEAALMRGVGIGEDVLGRGEKAARFAQMEADLAALDEELYDPEAERRQQLQAFLIGTAGATNVGYAMAGGAAAAINLENRQKKNRRQRMVDRIALGERGMSMDTELGKAALSLGNQMFADFNANQRAAMSAAATLGAAKLRATVDMANLEFNKNKEENAQKFRYDELDIRKLENDTKAAYNNELSIARRNEAILRGMASGEKTVTDIQEAAAERFNLAELQGAIAIAGDNEEAREEATRAFNMANAEATAYAAEILDQLGVLDRMNDLENMFLELNGVDAMPGINPDDITDVQPKR
jgi:hypothetical protein